MNSLEELVEVAEKEGIIYLNDFVDFISLRILVENLKHRIYEILRKKDHDKPTLADSFILK